jgi:hypothetical protein
MDLIYPAMLLIATFCAFNGLLTRAMIRRLRLLESATMKDAGDALPQAGASPGPFAVRTRSGLAVTDADLRDGEMVLVLLSPECQPCRDLVSHMASSWDTVDTGVLVVVHGDGTLESTGRLMAALPEGIQVAIDESGAVAGALGATAYPSVVLIRDGAVVAAAHEFEPVYRKRLSVTAGS